MKLEELRIDGFGAWSGLRLKNLDVQLAVVCGPNETGKTTIVQFVRGVLFGFSAERRRRYLPPVHGGRWGGSISIRTSEGLVTVTRTIEPGEQGEDSIETVSVVDADGTPQGEGALAQILGGIDEPIYRNVFAVGLREIQELGAIDDTAAAELLYKLASGIDRVSLADAVGELGAAREAIISSEGGPCDIRRLLDERRQLRTEQAQLSQLSEEYLQLRDESTSVAARIERTEGEVEQLSRDALDLEVAADIYDRWQQRCQVETQLEALGPGPTVEQRVLDDLEGLAADSRRIAGRARQFIRRGRKLRRQAAQLAVNPRFAEQAPRIEAMLEQRGWIAGIDDHCRKLEEQIDLAELELAEALEQGGLHERDLDRAESRRPDSAQLRHRLRTSARAVSSARSELKQAKAEVAAADAEREAMSRRLKDALGRHHKTDIVAALEEAGSKVSALRRRVQLDEKLDESARQQTDLERQATDLLVRELLPAWVVIGLGAAFVVGVVAILVGLLFPETIIGSAGWALATVGGVGAAAAVGGKMLLEHAAEQKSDACQQQLEMLRSQHEDAREERAELDRSLPAGGGPLLARLDAAEKEHAELEALLPMDAERRTAETTATAARSRLDSARQALDLAGGEWKQALKTAGLSTELSPEQARQALGSRTVARRCRRQVEQLRTQHRQSNETRTSFRERLERLVLAAGLPLPVGDFSAQLDGLQSLVAEQAQMARRRSELAGQHQLIRGRLKRLRARRRRLDARRRALIAEYRVTDEAMLRQQVLRTAQCRALQNRREELSREIAACLGNRVTHDRISAILADRTRDHIETRAAEVARQIDEHKERLHEWRYNAGAIDQRLGALTADIRPAQTMLRLSAVDGLIRDRIGRWRVLAVADQLLADVRNRFERERQPETLREASLYFARLTEGRYRRVWTPLAENMLLVDDDEGRALPVEVLSRGTREQLFLSLRLALISSYARRGVSLPVLLDDVLVNFDEPRAAVAARVLREYARSGGQILVFTCHEHIAALLHAQDVPVRTLPSNRSPLMATATIPPPAAEQPELIAVVPQELVTEIEPVVTAAPPKRRRRRRTAEAPTVSPPAKDIDSRTTFFPNPFGDTLWHLTVDDASIGERPSDDRDAGGSAEAA